MTDRLHRERDAVTLVARELAVPGRRAEVAAMRADAAQIGGRAARGVDRWRRVAARAVARVARLESSKGVRVVTPPPRPWKTQGLPHNNDVTDMTYWIYFPSRCDIRE